MSDYTPEPELSPPPEARRWLFANNHTGVFIGRSYVGTRELLALNTPADAVAYECGPGERPDIMAQRVDIVTGALVEYQPPAPADDQWQTWAWDVDLKRWVSVPTLLAHKRAARQRMAEAWNVARTAGVTFGTKTAPTDADSWTRYLAIKEMAADGGWVDVPIPLADGNFELMTQAKMVTLWGALKDMERTLLGRLRDRVQSINAATTPEEVAAVVW